MLEGEKIGFSLSLFAVTLSLRCPVSTSDIAQVIARLQNNNKVPLYGQLLIIPLYGIG